MTVRRPVTVGFCYALVLQVRSRNLSPTANDHEQRPDPGRLSVAASLSWEASQALFGLQSGDTLIGIEIQKIHHRMAQVCGNCV
jgi:hypothetical protein